MFVPDGGRSLKRALEGKHWSTYSVRIVSHPVLSLTFHVVVRMVDPLVKHDRSFSICVSDPCEQRGLMKEEMGSLRNTK